MPTAGTPRNESDVVIAGSAREIGLGEHRPLLLRNLDVEEARDAPHLTLQARFQIVVVNEQQVRQVPEVPGAAFLARRPRSTSR
jgi:hypothetical protein